MSREYLALTGASRIDRLRNDFKAAAAEALCNPFFGLPSWANEETREQSLNRPILCCGSNDWAHYFIGNMGPKAEIPFVVDDFRVGQSVLGRPCISSFEMIDFIKKHPETVCVNVSTTNVGAGFFEIIAEEHGVRMLNFEQAARFYRFKSDIRLEDWKDVIAARADEYIETESLLCDDFSKEVLYSVLLSHLRANRDGRVFVSRPLPDCYFSAGFFAPREDEVYVDCGAYDGDSVRDFVCAARGKFRSVHAFEADPQNYKKLEGWLTRNRKHQFSNRISLYSQAVGAERGTLTFTETGGAGSCISAEIANGSRVGAVEGVQVPVVSLDEIVKEPISLLKLDIEGAELNALKGARGHLLRSKPNVVTCAYHLPTDLIDLPRFFKSLDLGYNLGLRHFSQCRFDTMLFAF